MESDAAKRHDVVDVAYAPAPGFGEIFMPDPCPWLTELSAALADYDPALIDDDLIDDLPWAPFDVETIDPSLLGPSGLPARTVDGLDRLVDELLEADRELSRAHARRARLLAQADDWAESMVDSVVPIGATEPHRREMAHRSIAAEISCALRIPQQTVAADIAEAVTLSGMPATMASLDMGRIGYRHAQAIAETSLSVPAEGRGSLEAELLPIAESSTVARLKRKAREVRERVHPQPIVERTRQAIAGRRIVLEAADDGMGWIHHYLPIPIAVGIYETVNQIATGMRSAREPRTMDQLRSDVLSELIDEGIDAFVRGVPVDPTSETQDSGSGRARRPRIGALRPSVFLTVPVLTAMGRGDEPAVLEGYGPIDPVTARELAAEAPSFHRVLTDPVTGTVLDIDRNRYRPPADMRRWLRMRDKTCRFPFCGKRAVDADIDHTLAWVNEGKTRVQNLAHFCRGDHTLKHETSWQVVQRDGGVLHWVSPSGRCYTTVPGTPIGRQALGDARAQLADDHNSKRRRPIADAATSDSPTPF